MLVLFTNRSDSYSPSYLEAYRDGILESNIIKGEALLKNCRLCPRNCEVNRYIEEGKVCAIGKSALVSSNFPHFGEESCLVGSHGSGTIFLPAVIYGVLFVRIGYNNIRIRKRSRRQLY